MRDGLIRVAREYLAAKRKQFKGHALANYIRRDLPAQASALLGAEYKKYKIKGSAGQGRWADSPWLALMDPLVTGSAEKGYYAVYLFSPDFSRVVLTLGLGAYSVRKEFKSRAPEVLKERTRILRSKVPEARGRFQFEGFGVGSPAHQGEDWEISSAFGKVYAVSSMPSDSVLADDLAEMLRLYGIAIFRGGYTVLEDQEDLEEEEGPKRKPGESEKEYLEGQRRFRFHKRMERARNSALVRDVKARHGFTCEGCGFEFFRVYGKAGIRYIDAHHLTPLHLLTGDGPRRMNPDSDFAVLCANCHRMIHKMGCPSLADFRTKLANDYLELSGRLFGKRPGK